MKILVTGGTGLVGAHLVRALVQDGKSVRATRRAGSSLRQLTDVAHLVEWVEADLNDLIALEAAFEGIEQVYHCAAVVSFLPEDVERMMLVNVQGTANLVNMCLEKKVKKLVHVSSIAAIGRAIGHSTIDEKTKWTNSKLNSHYAISKYQSEMEVWRGHAEGLPVAIVNPTIILGEGDWSNGSIRFFEQIYRGLKFYPVGATGFVDVLDVVRFMRLLMDSDISGERFLLNAENLSFKQFFEQLAKELGVPAPHFRVAPGLAEIYWRWEWFRSKITGSRPMVSKESARSSSRVFYFLNEKSRSVFNFQYRNFSETVSSLAGLYLKSLGR